MAKIETYILATQPLSFNDMLIGTEVGGPIPNATKNFSLGELYNLFASVPAVGNLQQTLNAGNTATQNIFLTGNIESSTIKPVYIIDGLNSTGAVGEVLIRSFSGISWGPIPASTLQSVLNAGNTATQNIILTGNITSTQIIPGNIKDGLGNLGTTGQILSKTATGIQWINAPLTAPDLQAVTNIGYTTTNPIEAQGGIWSVYNIYGMDNTGSLYLNSAFFGLGATNELYALNPSATNLWALPNASGTIALLSDIPVITTPNLQSVLNAGNTATQNIFLTGNITATDIKPVTITDETNVTGTLGQVLTRSASGLIWATPAPTSPLTTKGDLYTFSTVNTRLSVGTNGQILSADSTQATGLRWINIPTDVTNVSAVMVNPSQTVVVTNPTTTPTITIDDTNLLYNKFMVNQYSYLLPSDGNVLWDTLRVGGTILQTGTVSALSETPMGQLFTTALAVGSVTGLFGTSFGGSGYLGVNFDFDFSYRFRINTNNGAQRLFCGVSSLYATATPTNVEPTTQINSIGVAKLQATANLYFIWNDATGTASSLDLGAGFSGVDTACTYRMRIYKVSGAAAITLELTKVVNATGVVTTTSTVITSDYNTGATMYPVIWMGNNTAVSGAVSFKNYGCQMTKHGLVNA